MKKVIKLAFVAVFVAVAGYGVYVNQNADAISDLTLANVAALAMGEDSGCPNGCVDKGQGCTCNGVHYPYWKEYGSAN